MHRATVPVVSSILVASSRRATRVQLGAAGWRTQARMERSGRLTCTAKCHGWGCKQKAATGTCLPRPVAGFPLCTARSWRLLSRSRSGRRSWCCRGRRYRNIGRGGSAHHAIKPGFLKSEPAMMPVALHEGKSHKGNQYDEQQTHELVPPLSWRPQISRIRRKQKGAARGT